MELPLFPLNTVLFPGAVIPIHVFEERYKAMIVRCLERKEPFGIVLIRSGREVGGPAVPYEVGTVARIGRVERLEDGRMNLLVLGERRFRIRELRQTQPYLVAEVELLPEEDGQEVQELADTVAALFSEFMRLSLAVTGQWARTVRLPSGPAALADFVAHRLPIDLRQKQRLLETLSARARLEMEAHVLKESIQELTRQVAAMRAQRWGGFWALN